MLGNQFVEGWRWELGGFVVIGALLFGTVLAYELITRNVHTIAYRAAVGMAMVAALVLVWMNFMQAADDVKSATVMYLGGPLVGSSAPGGIIGAALARLPPDGWPAPCSQPRSLKLWS